MDKDMFVESFLLRFADTVDTTRNYRIKIYDINEVPPKVSVKVDSATVLTFDAESLLMSTSYNALVESIRKADPYIERAYNDPNSLIGQPIEEDGDSYH